ncbi:unnamed protein product [Pleuronectes platessa]|uniref:Uncharacterized protein n=1 Tax=Pleuronectes platessa TaxID=8262 RepID=A0A9N7YB40_PLEPL|nr:unnamed protein product [Pleuronectes platessa]
MDFGDPQDATYDPDDSITVLTESADVTMEFSNPVHWTPTYIVFENCLLELFEDPAPYVNEVLKISIPKDLSAKYEKPDKQEVIASYVSIREHSAYLEHHAGGRTTLILRPDSPNTS